MVYVVTRCQTEHPHLRVRGGAMDESDGWGGAMDAVIYTTVHVVTRRLNGELKLNVDDDLLGLPAPPLGCEDTQHRDNRMELAITSVTPDQSDAGSVGIFSQRTKSVTPAERQLVVMGSSSRSSAKVLPLPQPSPSETPLLLEGP
eukprot:719289-Prorocentrum_minimum.AAC.1